MNRRTFLLSSIASVGLISAGAVYWPERWKYIVIHHSAGAYGDIDFLRKVHKERQSKDPIDAIPYHYIIGNGNGLKEGEIASGWRQKHDVWGAHVSFRNVDYDLRGIGICLIGDHEVNPVSEPQYNALIALTKRLMNRYGIAVDNVVGHGSIKGESTKCPGKLFPMTRFKQDLA